MATSETFPAPFRSRRALLASAAAAASACLAAGCADRGAGGEGEITASEDLMREHGVVHRVMILYDEAARRLEQRQDLPLETVASTAALVRTFIEDYHERTEEELVFPRFEAAGAMTGLVAILRRQHQRGRELTDAILRLAGQAQPSDEDRRELAARLRSFDHLYRPHAAREDTVLFPAFAGLVGERDYRSLGERFEEREQAQLGERGFEHAVERIAALERTLGIDDLASA